MITKELLEESFKLLKNDPHYYINNNVEELYEEVAHLKEQVTALERFADSLDIIDRNNIAKNLAKKNLTHNNN